MIQDHVIHRIAHDRVERFRQEAAIGSHRPSVRRRAAATFRRIAAWIEPRDSHPYGARYASD